MMVAALLLPPAAVVAGILGLIAGAAMTWWRSRPWSPKVSDVSEAWLGANERDGKGWR